MLSYKLDFNSCAIRDGFCKSSHIYIYIYIYIPLESCSYIIFTSKFKKIVNFKKVNRDPEKLPKLEFEILLYLRSLF